MEAEQPLLLRVVADGETVREEGAVTVPNSCLSGGAIEIFLEPVLPAPRVLVAGDSPIVAALRGLGPEVGLEMVAAHDIQDGVLAPSAGDLALVVAAHGNDEVATLRAGLEAGVRYVGLVASRKRGAAVIDELRAEGVSEELLQTPGDARGTRHRRSDTRRGRALDRRSHHRGSARRVARQLHARGGGRGAGLL